MIRRTITLLLPRACKLKTNSTKMALSCISFTPGLVLNLCVVMLGLLLHISQACDKSSILQDETVLKKMITHANIAVKGLITNTYNDENNKEKEDAYIAEVWLLDVYKGGDILAESMGIKPAVTSKTFNIRDK